MFVNNVSLGVYAEAVQREGYRDAKLRTIAETMPTVLGPSGDTLDLRFSGADGREQKTSAVVLVSNNPYRLGRAIASGTRPRLDAGVLGITVIGAGAARDGAKRVQQWSARIVRGPLRRAGRGRHRRRSSQARPARCALRPGHRPCACGSLRNTRAPHHPRPCRKARGTRSARSPTSPRTVLPSDTRLQRPGPDVIAAHRNALSRTRQLSGGSRGRVFHT